MSFKVKSLESNRPTIETETAREAAAVVVDLQEKGVGTVKVEIEDERLSAAEMTVSERELRRGVLPLLPARGEKVRSDSEGMRGKGKR